MKKHLLVFSVIMILASIVTISAFERDDDFRILVDKSGPYVGVNTARDLGYYGDGIKIAVIDTGVDYNHPDLLGYGESGKVIGGKNFIEEGQNPLDLNGHGTEVAGIIAADGSLKGIAPKAKILSYKVSDNGESVSSDLIIKAIDQAITDKVDIINISLGVNKTNSKIDDAVNRAIQSGIVVVDAAGNDGPGISTIGSPGINPNGITVGATYNNLTASLVATLDVNGTQYQVIPMVGVESVKQPIEAQIKFAKFGRVDDFKGDDFKDSIALVERGNDIKDQLVYFSDKESNAVAAGARAVIVYNNEPGIFLGELLHEFTKTGYSPSIPTVSISREDGLKIKEMLEEKTIGKLEVFYHPDYVAFFSSRGPVSPFYIKPDLVAPGVFINTTLANGKYNFTSGTSFAAPHVSGAAALILEKNPDLKPDEVKSLILTTTDPVDDAYGNMFPSNISGFGRLNITKAFESNLIIQPPFVTLNLSDENQSDDETIKIKSIDGKIGKINYRFDGPEFVEFSNVIKDDYMTISAKLKEKIYGDYDARLFITEGNSIYNIPIILHITRASIITTENDGKFDFQIKSPVEWTFAKVSAVEKDSGKIYTTSLTPNKKSSIQVSASGEYWITALITSPEKTFETYDRATILTNNHSYNVEQTLGIPTRQIVIIIGVIALIGVIGVLSKR